MSDKNIPMNFKESVFTCPFCPEGTMMSWQYDPTDLLDMAVQFNKFVAHINDCLDVLIKENKICKNKKEFIDHGK